MKQVIVLASHKLQFINFIRHFRLNANDCKFVLGHQGYSELYGYHWDTPVLLLDNYQHNENYNLDLLTFIGHRFNNIGFLSEGEMYNEGVKF